MISNRNADSLALFIKNHTTSNYFKNSANKRTKKDKYWEIYWPPYKIDQANSIYIGYTDHGFTYGAMQFSFEEGKALEFAGGQGPNKVVIWRDFDKVSLSKAKDLGVFAGVAYLKTEDNSYIYIRKVDLNKSDKDLCVEFGILKEQSWKTDGCDF